MKGERIFHPIPEFYIGISRNKICEFTGILGFMAPNVFCLVKGQYIVLLVGEWATRVKWLHCEFMYEFKYDEFKYDEGTVLGLNKLTDSGGNRKSKAGVG